MEIAWLAGLFEGEGCISDAGKSAIQLTIASTDLDVLQRVVKFGGKIYGPILRKISNPKHKTIWSWKSAARDEYIPILFAIIPFLCQRRKIRAEEALIRVMRQFERKPPPLQCYKGHPYNQENTYWYRGSPVCRLCKRLRSKKA